MGVGSPSHHAAFRSDLGTIWSGFEALPWHILWLHAFHFFILRGSTSFLPSACAWIGGRRTLPWPLVAFPWRARLRSTSIGAIPSLPIVVLPRGRIYHGGCGGGEVAYNRPRPPSRPTSLHNCAIPLPRPSPPNASQPCGLPGPPSLRMRHNGSQPRARILRILPGLSDQAFPFVPFDPSLSKGRSFGFGHGASVGRVTCGLEGEFARDAHAWEAFGDEGAERKAQEDAGKDAAARREPVRATSTSHVPKWSDAARRRGRKRRRLSALFAKLD